MTDTAPASLTGPRPGARFRAHTRIDWKTAARVIGAGGSAGEAAAAIGVDEDRLWRHWRRSPRFRRLLTEQFERRRGLAGLNLEVAIREAALARCLAPDGLEIDVAMLAALAGLPGTAANPAPASREPAGAAERIAAMGRNASLPQPRRRRPDPQAALREARTGVLRAVADRAAQLAATAGPAAAPPEMRPPGPEQPAAPAVVHRVSAPSGEPAGTNPAADRPERAETGQNGTKRAETGQNGPERTATAPPRHDSGGETPRPSPYRFRARPDFITDLPSPDFPDGIPYARDLPDEADEVKQPRRTG